MSLCSWVNVVVGKMTGINRTAKYVVVSKEKKVPYDYLVLCTGQSYQVRCVHGEIQHGIPRFPAVNGVPGIKQSSLSKGSTSSLQPCGAAGWAVSVLLPKPEERRVGRNFPPAVTAQGWA